MTDTSTNIERRSFLLAGAAAGAGATLAGPFAALGAQPAGAAHGRGRGPGHDGGYGELQPVRDQTTGLELLALPRGFEYLSFGWTNDPLADGTPTPGSHDGMAAFRDGDLVRLVRNHERGGGTPFGGPVYDPAAAGGTTNLVFDPDRGRWLEAYASLSGTIRNCAGGPTPGGSWLTCEETTFVNTDGTRHGYVFEVPAGGTADPVPLTGMGRFSHEATATDPDTGIVYETEDAGSSALYRYVPRDADRLAAGGVLQAMVLEGTTDTATWDTGDRARASWVTVEEPDWGPGEPTTWDQASAEGAARIVRGEGAWQGNGVIYVVSTSGGPVGQGQVFAYDPRAETFTCVFASPGSQTLNNPDNIAVSPRGGIVLCEDGSGDEFIHGLTPDGDIFPFARNNVVLSPEVRDAKGYGNLDYTSAEWAGATFEPKAGNWMFVNIQGPGITFAITGPWRLGAL